MEYWSKPYSADGECYAVRNISDKPLTVIQVLDYSGNVSPFARPWDSGKELPFVVKPGELGVESRQLFPVRAQGVVYSLLERGDGVCDGSCSPGSLTCARAPSIHSFALAASTTTIFR